MLWGSTPPSCAKCAGDGIGRHVRAMNPVLRVRLPPCAPYALLAQLAEQRIFNPKVVGSKSAERTNMLRVAQLVRAPDCGSGGRRFEPAHAPHGTLAQLVERQTEDLRVSGSIPEGPTTLKAFLLR